MKLNEWSPSDLWCCLVKKNQPKRKISCSNPNPISEHTKWVYLLAKASLLKDLFVAETGFESRNPGIQWKFFLELKKMRSYLELGKLETKRLSWFADWNGWNAKEMSARVCVCLQVFQIVRVCVCLRLNVEVCVSSCVEVCAHMNRWEREREREEERGWESSVGILTW